MARGLGVLAVLGVAAAAACGSGDSPTDPGDDAVEVHLTTSQAFAPQNLTVAPGTKVRWINDSNTYHTITPMNPTQQGVWAEVETASLGPVFDFTFSVPGQTYIYRSTPYASDFTSGMVGRVVVTAQ